MRPTFRISLVRFTSILIDVIRNLIDNQNFEPFIFYHSRILFNSTKYFSPCKVIKNSFTLFLHPYSPISALIKINNNQSKFFLNSIKLDLIFFALVLSVLGCIRLFSFTVPPDSFSGPVERSFSLGGLAAQYKKVERILSSVISLLVAIAGPPSLFRFCPV